MDDDEHERTLAPCCGQPRCYCECPQFIRDRAAIRALARAEEEGGS